MNKLISIISATSAALLLAAGAQAGAVTEQRMYEATDVIRDFTKIPEQGIPSSILNNAYGVAVIPGVVKAGLIVGGRYGKGILTVRQEDGTWSNPSFISIGGGSVGFQIGAQSTDIVLVFKDRRSITNISSGKVTLGGDASVAAGPVGRMASASTDGRMTAEIYSYSRNRGLFAGVALDGAWIGMDKKANKDYYGGNVSAMQILDSSNMPAPASTEQFIGILAAIAPKFDAPMMRPETQSRSAQISAAPAPASAPAEVRTFSIDPVNGGGDETSF